MFDREIISAIRTHEDDRARIPYVCQNPDCRRETYAPPGLTAIICGHCGRIDTSTELARQGWRNAVEARLEDKPDKTPPVAPLDLVAMILGLLLVVLA